MTKPGCPCKDCLDRYVGCHGQCEKYRKWKEGNEEFQKLQRKNMENELIGFIPRRRR